MTLGDCVRIKSMEKNRWPTSDLRVGAYLRLAGFKIAETKRLGGRVVFDFEDRPDREDQVRKFFNREVSVEPLAYMASISELRDMVTMTAKDPQMARQGGQ